MPSLQMTAWENTCSGISNNIIRKINISFNKYSGFSISAAVQCECAVFSIIIGNHMFFFFMKIVWTVCVCVCGVRTNSSPHAYHLFHPPLLLHRRFWGCLDRSWCSWVNQKFKKRLVLTQLCKKFNFQCLRIKILIKGANSYPFPSYFF